MYHLSQDKDAILAPQNATHMSHRDERIIKEVPFQVRVIQEFAIVLFFVIGVLNLYSMRRKQLHNVQKQKNAQKNKNSNRSTDCAMQKLNDSRDDSDDDFLFSNFDFLFSQRT